MKRGFSLFSFQHLVAVFITVLSIYIFLRILERCDPEKLKRRFNVPLAILLVFQNILWRIIFFARGDFDVKCDLPLHVCSVTQFLLAYHLVRPSKTVFNVTYYWVIAGSTFALVIPDLQEGFPSVRFFEMFASHGLSIFTVLYLMIIQKNFPTNNSYWTAFAALNILALIDAPVNIITKGNYLYLRSVPEVDFEPINWLPPWPWYILVLEIFFLIIYWLIYQPYALYEKHLEVKSAGNHS